MVSTERSDGSSADRQAEREALLVRARQLVGELRERVPLAERARRIPDETARAFRDAGFFKVLQPAVFGGLELPYPTHYDVACELARGCPSSAWVMGVLASHALIFGMFEGHVQEAFWREDPSKAIATSFFADRVSIAREGDGFRIAGRWKYSSGVDHCDAALLMAAVAPASPGPPQPYFFFVPRNRYRVEDTWHAAGLIATGSNDIVVDEFVLPAEHALPVAQTALATSPGGAYHANYLYRLPLFAVFPYTLLGTAIGATQGALDTLTDGLITRASTANVKLREAQAVQMRIGEAAAELDAARALLAQDRVAINEAGRAERLPDVPQRVRYKLHYGYAARRCVEAVERIYPLVGAQGLSADHPVQRAQRDTHAVAQHIGLVWDVQTTNFGAVALGLEPPDKRI